MRKVGTILLSVYFLFGSFILPDCDFALLSNLQKIYGDFVVLNGQTSYTDFLDEQFIDGFQIFEFDNEKDEPGEKEQKPVPIDYLVTQQQSVFKIQTITVEFPEPKTIIKVVEFYQNFYKSINPESVFHPPKSIV